MANTDNNNRKKASSKDIALDKFDFYETPKTKKKTSHGDKIKGRPKNPFIRFLQAVFPQKDDTNTEMIRKIVLIGAVIIFIGTLVFLGWQIASMNNGEKTNSEIADLAGSPNETIDFDIIDFDNEPFNTNPLDSSAAIVDESEEINVTPVTNTPLNIDFNALKQVNPDTRGWVKITGTPINNVVVQSNASDPHYYLTHDFYKNESITGTIYSSYKNKWDGTDQNIILVGHNMRSGQFFATVRHYVPNDTSREPVAFYKVHPTVMLATPDGGSQTYKIFAGILANTQEEYGDVFEYINKTSFKDKDDFNNFIIDVMDRSWFFTDVDITYGDQLLTMSTCYWPLGKEVDTRWVIFARKVRPGESEYVDTTVAKRNYQAKLFRYYYELIGSEWYGSVWDKSKLLSY